jgi:hypothetical protein
MSSQRVGKHCAAPPDEVEPEVLRERPTATPRLPGLTRETLRIGFAQALIVPVARETEVQVKVWRRHRLPLREIVVH